MNTAPILHRSILSVQPDGWDRSLEHQVKIDLTACSYVDSSLNTSPIRCDHPDSVRAGTNGCCTPEKATIEVVGNPELADERWGFSVGDNGASMVGDGMWFGPLKRFQKLFFHTPLVKLFVFGSEVYHDYYRWPLRDRKIFEGWRASTKWGRLFDKYQGDGTLMNAGEAERTA